VVCKLRQDSTATAKGAGAIGGRKPAACTHQFLGIGSSPACASVRECASMGAYGGDVAPPLITAVEFVRGYGGDGREGDVRIGRSSAVADKASRASVLASSTVSRRPSSCNSSADVRRSARRSSRRRARRRRSAGGSDKLICSSSASSAPVSRAAVWAFPVSSSSAVAVAKQPAISSRNCASRASSRHSAR